MLIQSTQSCWEDLLSSPSDISLADISLSTSSFSDIESSPATPNMMMIPPQHCHHYTNFDYSNKNEFSCSSSVSSSTVMPSLFDDLSSPDSASWTLESNTDPISCVSTTDILQQQISDEAVPENGYSIIQKAAEVEVFHNMISMLGAVIPTQSNAPLHLDRVSPDQPPQSFRSWSMDNTPATMLEQVLPDATLSQSIPLADQPSVSIKPNIDDIQSYWSHQMTASTVPFTSPKKLLHEKNKDRSKAVQKRRAKRGAKCTAQSRKKVATSSSFRRFSTLSKEGCCSSEVEDGAKTCQSSSMSFTTSKKISLKARSSSGEEEIDYPRNQNLLQKALSAKGPVAPGQADPLIEVNDSIFRRIKDGEVDIYTPRWSRGAHREREGWCHLCEKGGWYSMKRSQYLYHLQYEHGISSQTKKVFDAPKAIRIWNDAVQSTEGLCGNCNSWIAICFGPVRKRNFKVYFKHIHACQRSFTAAASPSPLSVS